MFGFFQFLFPHNTCLVCGAKASPLCLDCRKQMASLTSCRHCACFIRPEDKVCSSCQRDKPPFALARAALPYEGELRQRLKELKYYNKAWLARPLAALLHQAYDIHYRGMTFDGLVAVPLSPRRKRQREYNQAERLANFLAGNLGFPLLKDGLQRAKDTPPLHNVGRRERYALLQDCFVAVPGQVSGRRLLLIDDIYTTGATCFACSQALLSAGAGEVCVLTVAAGRSF